MWRDTEGDKQGRRSEEGEWGAAAKEVKAFQLPKDKERSADVGATLCGVGEEGATRAPGRVDGGVLCTMSRVGMVTANRRPAAGPSVLPAGARTSATRDVKQDEEALPSSFVLPPSHVHCDLDRRGEERDADFLHDDDGERRTQQYLQPR